MSDPDVFDRLIIADTAPSTSTAGALVLPNGGLSILNTTLAVSLSSGGGLTVLGGASINQNALVGGQVQLLSTIPSTNTSTGALIANGGVAIQGSLFANLANLNNVLVNTSATIPSITGTFASIGSASMINFTTSNLFVTTATTIANALFTNITTTNLTLSNSFSAQTINVTGTTSSWSTSSGTMVISGGLGINQNIFASKGYFGDMVNTVNNSRGLQQVDTRAAISCWRWVPITGSNVGNAAIEFIAGTAGSAAAVGNNWSDIYMDDSASIGFRNRTTGGSLTTFWIGQTGNIGINNTAPNYDLDVRGGSRITECLTVGNAILTTNLMSTNLTVPNVSFINLASNIATIGSIVATNISNTNTTTISLYVTNSTFASSVIATETVGNSFMTNVLITNTTSANIYSSNISSTNSTLSSTLISMATIVNSTITNLTNANLITSNHCTANFIASSATIPNLLTTNFNTVNISVANAVGTNANFTNVSAGTLALSNLYITNETVTNVIASSISTGSLYNTFSTITNILSTNNSTTNANITNLTAGTLSLVNINATNETVINLLATNSTFSNMVNSNMVSANAGIVNLSNSNATVNNAIITNGTIGQIVNTNTTSQGLLVTGSCSSNTIYIDAQNSTTNPAQIIFKNTAYVGDFRIGGDGGDVQWIGGGGRCMQFGAYHEVRILGGRATTSTIPQVNGSGSTYNTIIQNNNDSLALNIWANSTQTQNLTTWAGSSGTPVYASVSATGAFSINNTTTSTNVSSGAFVSSGGGGFNGNVYASNFFSTTFGQLGIFGSSYNYAQNTAGSGVTNTVQSSILTMTTGTLASGTYLVQPSYSYTIGLYSKQAGVRLYQTNTNGTLLHDSLWTSSSTTLNDKLYQMDNVVITVGQGIQTFVMTARNASTGFTTTISNIRLVVHRVA